MIPPREPQESLEGFLETPSEPAEALPRAENTAIIAVSPHYLERVARARQESAERAARLGVTTRASNTEHAYAQDWKLFAAWCRRLDRDPYEVSPAQLVEFFAWMEEVPAVKTRKPYAPSSILRMYNGISWELRKNPKGNWPMWKPDAVRIYFDGLRRRSAVKGITPKKKEPIGPGTLLAMFPHAGEGLIGMRNRAILALGWDGTFRRASITGLDVADVSERRLDTGETGLVVHLRRSKEDQKGRGRDVGIPYHDAANAETCPVRLLRAWIKASGVTEGPLFRPVMQGVVGSRRLDPRIVARIVKYCAEKIGLDPLKYGGHSLRRGFITTAHRVGLTDEQISAHTGQTVKTVRDYVAPDHVLRDNMARGVFSRGLEREAGLDRRRARRGERKEEAAAEIVEPTTLLDAMGKARAADETGEQRLVKVKRKKRP